ncbi:hypothetical protein [Microcystis sp. LE18-22.4A]|jgi:hypothetical protein|uniref:hypothetical protein n=1 Tax=Microcystis sp. LE18-22.4A TaxID=3016432 RepID=UPI0025837588|nr:hypothetical protein [Microcystis sp. LE18-22.4A]
MTTLLYCILKSRFWQRIVMTSFIPLTYEERGMLPAKNPTENGFLKETRFLDKKLITFSLDLTLK